MLEKFESFKRTSGMTMASFILEFERLHSELKDYGCTYPDGVLAYRVMKSANISKEHEQLCRATVESDKWSYALVCQQLRKIFNDFSALQSSVSERPTIKLEQPSYVVNEINSEDCYFNNYDECHSLQYENYTDDDHDVSNLDDANNFYQDVCKDTDEVDIYYGASRNSRYNTWNKPSYQNSRNRTNPGWKPNPDNQRSNSSRDNKVNEYRKGNSVSYNPYSMNARDNRGNPTICRKCRSTYHWWENCPHVTPQERMNSTRKTYYTQNNG